MSSTRWKLAEAATVVGLTALVAWAYARFQPRIQIQGGLGWDGVSYAALFDLLRGGAVDPVAFPFCNRIGTPWLASLLPVGAAIDGFAVVNTLAAVVFAWTMVALARAAGFGRLHGLVALFLALAPLSAPARVVPYYPVYTDPVFLALLGLSTLALVRRRGALSLLVLALAFPVREVALYLVPLYGAFALTLQGASRSLWVSFALAMLAMLMMKIGIAQALDCHGAQWRIGLHWLRQFLSDPQRVIAVVASISLVAAPAVYLPRVREPDLLVRVSAAGGAVAMALAIVGGTDVVRIFYSFLPLYLLALLAVFRAMGPGFTVLALCGYCIVNRVGMPLLQPQGAMPAGDLEGLFWQVPDKARPEVGLMILAVWALLFGLHQVAAAPRRGAARG